MDRIKMIVISAMKTAAVLLLIPAALACMAGRAGAEDAAVLVEIFYLPHRPAEAVVKDVEGIVAQFNGITLSKYNFEDPNSRKLLEKYGLKEHMPVAIFINGKNEFLVDGKSISLRNFPKGNTFVPMFEGSWTYGDVKAVLESATKGR